MATAVIPSRCAGVSVGQKASRLSCLRSSARYRTRLLDRSRVLYLADDRKQASLDAFWPTLTPAQRDGITAVAMDMWEPYVQSTRAHLPDAASKIVFDKFHVVKHLHEAVD